MSTTFLSQHTGQPVEAPMPFLSQRTGQPVSDAKVRAILDRRSLAPVDRTAFTDRLGIPATATDTEFLAAVDAKLAASAPVPIASPNEAIYARVYGGRPSSQPPTPVDMSDDDLYACLYGSAV